MSRQQIQRFAEDCGMRYGQAQHLIRLADKAKETEERAISERVDNDKHREAADKAGKAVEEYAARFGLKTTWPGLYPVFMRDKRNIFLPG